MAAYPSGLMPVSGARPGAGTPWRYLAVLTAVGLVTLLAGWQGPTAEWLRYDRAAVEQGEYWRLLTGHLVHGSATHWLLNLTGLGLVVGLFADRESPAAFCLSLPVLAFGVSAGLWLWQPELAWYVGLSGVLHGLFAWLVLRQLRDRCWVAGVALAMLLAKLFYEQCFAADIGTASLVGVPVVVDAHLYGALTGTLFALLFRGLPKARTVD